MNKLVLAIVLLVLSGAELVAQCPYRAVRSNYAQKYHGGQPYRTSAAPSVAMGAGAYDDVDADTAADADLNDVNTTDHANDLDLEDAMDVSSDDATDALDMGDLDR